ncbi:MAG TPA: TonB family protein [Cyclobacteriaceae bacterium]|nr:TonB family protein [Cyclobacteriaceae bacterium]
MKSPLILLLILAVSVFATAQKMGKFFYNNQWELTTRDSAAYVRMCVYDTVNHYFAGPITDMYLSGKPQMKGTYKAAKKEGEFTFFYESGVLEAVGSFKEDHRTGPWTFNHPDGKPKMEVDFAGNNARIISLYDEDGTSIVKDGNGEWYEEYEEYGVPGKIIVTGELKKYGKHGTWTCKLSNGDLIYTEDYKNGEFVRGFIYPAGIKTKNERPHGNQVIIPFKFIVTEAFGATPGTDFNSYPFLDVMRRGDKSFYNPKNPAPPKDEVYTVDVYPAPIGGIAKMYKFLGDNMRYPPNSRRMRIEGKVWIAFVVDKDGSLIDFEISKGIAEDLDREALRVFKKYGETYKWNPGEQRGKPVRVKMVIPLTFKLG